VAADDCCAASSSRTRAPAARTEPLCQRSGPEPRS
jgi:hypothetical protein